MIDTYTIVVGVFAYIGAAVVGFWLGYQWAAFWSKRA